MRWPERPRRHDAEPALQSVQVRGRAVGALGSCAAMGRMDFCDDSSKVAWKARRGISRCPVSAWLDALGVDDVCGPRRGQHNSCSLREAATRAFGCASPSVDEQGGLGVWSPRSALRSRPAAAIGIGPQRCRVGRRRRRLAAPTGRKPSGWGSGCRPAGQRDRRGRQGRDGVAAADDHRRGQPALRRIGHVAAGSGRPHQRDPVPGGPARGQRRDCSSSSTRRSTKPTCSRRART